ncbi:hypothetical protein ACOME3_000281 [Neoechinorhynchus agilis]
MDRGSQKLLLNVVNNSFSRKRKLLDPIHQNESNASLTFISNVSNAKISRLQKMYLPIIPPPEYIEQELQQQLPLKTNEIEKRPKRKRSAVTTPIRVEYNLRSKKNNVSDENKENIVTKSTRKRKRQESRVLSCTKFNILPSKQELPAEQLDLNLLGRLQRNRDYRCWKCPKCRRTSLEDIEHQQGQCGYKSCAFKYCTLCKSHYHPCRPCVEFIEKSSSLPTSLPKGHLRRC